MAPPVGATPVRGRACAGPALAARVEGVVIDREERKGKGASDHAPVIVQLTD